MSNNNSTTETGEKKFCISELIQEHETFEHIMDAKFLTSTKLCELISAMFSNIYADYEGCNMEFLPGSNTPSITLFFNHKNTDSALPFAFSKEDTDNKTTNSTLRSTRSFNNRLINGDKYYPTDKGYALEEFLFDNNNLYVTNKDGKRIPNWGKLIAEVADGNFQFMNVPQQYTQVKCLDPGKIVEAIFGRFDGNSEWVYGIRIVRSIPSFTMNGGVANSNFVVAIERVSKNEVDSLAKQFGLNTNAGLNIIR